MSRNKNIYLLPTIMALVLCPIQWKSPIGPLALSPSDALLVFSLGMFVCVERKKILLVNLAALLPPAAFVATAFLGIAYAVDVKQALKEALQLGTYCIGCCLLSMLTVRNATWRAFAPRIKLYVSGLVLGILIFILFTAGPATLLSHPGRWEFFASATLIAFLPDTTSQYERASAIRRSILAALVLIAGLAVCSIQASALMEPERYHEGFAALSALADYPLFGVGPGNYQLRIGEFYQGMPKQNLIEPGTRIGWTVLIASNGVLGAAVLSCWLRALWKFSPGAGRIFLVLWLSFSFVTTITTSAMLLPLAIFHGLVWDRELECE